MRYEDDWEKVRELGKGGQGTVSLVRRRVSGELASKGMKLLQSVTGGLTMPSWHHMNTR